MIRSLGPRQLICINLWECISRQNGRECDEDCNVKDRSSCQGDPNRNASQIIVHSLSSEPENNQFVLPKKLNSTEDQDSHSLVCILHTKC
jgi:hypothetical protein